MRFQSLAILEKIWIFLENLLISTYSASDSIFVHCWGSICNSFWLTETAFKGFVDAPNALPVRFAGSIQWINGKAITWIGHWSVGWKCYVIFVSIIVTFWCWSAAFDDYLRFIRTLFWSIFNVLKFNENFYETYSCWRRNCIHIDMHPNKKFSLILDWLFPSFASADWIDDLQLELCGFI